MSRRSPDQPNPNKNPKHRLVDRILLGGIAVMGTFLVVAQVVKDPEAFGDVIHATVGTETPREEKIRLALAQALGLEVSVHCVLTWASDGDRVIYGQHTSLFGIELNIIRLRDEVCDEATQDINDHPSEHAIMTIAHEAAHVQYDDDDGPEAERITECRAFQTAPAVARALGANDATVEAIIRDANTLVRPDEYIPPANCVDGGPYDVHPQQSGGTFPTLRQPA